MAEESLALPQYTLEDYMDSDAPFKFLYGVDDKFQQERLVQRMKIQAQSVGLRSFMKLWEAYKKAQRGQSEEVGNVSNFDALPEGVSQFNCGQYICNPDGVFIVDGYGFQKVVCPHPIAPIRRFVNVDTNEEYLEIWFLKYHDKFRTVSKKVVVSKDDIANGISKLAKYGVVVNPNNAKALSAYLMDIEQYNYDQLDEKKSVTRLGWIGEDREFSPYVDSVRFDGEEDFGSVFNSVTSSGSYEVWKNAIRKVRAEKTVARIYLAASFASVILKPCGLLPFLVHAWGGTENGKTVALMIAASVWANPELGEFITTFNGTRYAQETKAAFLNNLPLCLDELQIQSSQGKTDFDDIIYQLCEGVSKSQGKASGGLRKQLRWRNVILTNGEHPIVRDLSAGGAMNRVIEIEAPEPVYSDLVGICDIIGRNYGYAGREFVEWLQDDENIAKMREIQKGFYEKLKDGGATDKQVASASAILTADHIVTELIFRDKMALTVDDMLDILPLRESVDMNARAYEWLMDYIAMQHIHFNEESKVEFWGEINGDEVWFIRSVFNREMKSHGQDSKAFLSWAKRKGLIECEKNHLDKKKRFSGTSPGTRCVVLKVQNSHENEENTDVNSPEMLPF